MPAMRPFADEPSQPILSLNILQQLDRILSQYSLQNDWSIKLDTAFFARLLERISSFPLRSDPQHGHAYMDVTGFTEQQFKCEMLSRRSVVSSLQSPGSNTIG